MPDFSTLRHIHNCCSPQKEKKTDVRGFYVSLNFSSAPNLQRQGSTKPPHVIQIVAERYFPTYDPFFFGHMHSTRLDPALHSAGYGPDRNTGNFDMPYPC